MFKPEDFYLLRIPYLPVSYSEDVFKTEGFEDVVCYLKELCQRKDIQEAIFVASPVLYNEMEKAISGNYNREKEYQLFSSILKYIVRASSRSTPYGLFSGVCIGYLEDNTKIELSENDKYRHHVRLDMDFLDKIIQSISDKREVKPFLKYYPNTSCYKINDKLNYFETEMLNRTKTYNLCRIDYTEYLEKVLIGASQGASKAQILKCLEEDDFSEQEILDYIDELINNQILIHNLNFSISGGDALEELINKIQDLYKDGNTDLYKYIEILVKVKKVLNSELPILSKKLEVSKLILPIFDINQYEGDFFQVDLEIMTSHNQVSSKAIKEITEQISEITSVMKMPPIPDLEKFKQKFVNRYENQELELTHILDTEFGIGYGNSGDHLVGLSSLVDEINEYWTDVPPIIEADTFYNFIQSKLFEGLSNNLYNITITAEEVDKLRKLNITPPVMPNSAYILGSLLCNIEANINNGNYQFALDFCNGPSAATIMTRFAHLNSEIKKNIQDCIEKEEAVDPSVLYAEIIHVPQSREGNVVSKPILRQYEIPFLSNSNLPKENQIFVDDLLVSIKNGEVILRSKKLNKRIIPRLTNAHNFRFGNLPLYKFLCDLQFQGILSSFSWSWHNFSQLPFLPRVTYKNIILSPAKWNIEIKDTLKNSKDKKERLIAIDKAVRSFIKKHNLPDTVRLVEGDNRLLIKLSNKASFDILSKYLLKYGKATLCESFSSSENCFIKDKIGNKYFNEIVIPVTKLNPTESRISPIVDSSKNIDVQRTFIFGQEWVYLKIYAGIKTLDSLLKFNIPYLVEQLESKNLINKWFFIRYSDPDIHIRLRFNIKENIDFTTLIELINSTFSDEIDSGQIYKMYYDSYERELERYHGSMTKYSEDIFYIDSLYSLKLLQHINEENSDSRWMVALKSVNDYFDYFEFTIEQKIKIAEELAEGFYSEFGDPSLIRRDLNNLYRKKYALIENTLDVNEQTPINEFDKAFLLLEMRKKDILPYLKELIRNDQKARHLLPSHIHMSVNRFFASYQRKYEMIIYHFLTKFWNSKLQRGKHSIFTNSEKL